jgi:hypothetical protein
MKPVYIEVVTNVLTVYSHCNSCRPIFHESGVEDRVAAEALDDYPKDLKEEFLQLSDWIRDLVRLYRHRIKVRIVDAKSMLGIYKSLRHRFRKYPAFIVDCKDVVAGWDREKLDRILDEHIRQGNLRTAR